jgi:hypothetical protein
MLLFAGTLEPAEFKIGVGNNAIEAMLDIRAADVGFSGNTGRRYTHEDQQTVSPGDRGLEYASTITALSLNFPTL